MITDTERLDFLSQQHFTQWVGYDTPNGYIVWPVFAGTDIRAEIDKAIESSRKDKQTDKQTKEHVCGLKGFGYSISDICPACEEGR